MDQTQITIRPADAAGVADAVRRAAAEGVGLTVVGGGHGPWSHAPHPGIRLELARLDSVEVEGSVVHVGGGATWGAVADELHAHGLAVSSGDTASVGVGGLTLGGGLGWMVRAWGTAADQLVGAQVVTAAGEIVETSAQRHPDLFWALRGGGGNFGVVTRFDFAAHRLDGIVHAEFTVDGDPAPLLRAVRDAMRDAPHELSVTFMDVPPMDPSAPAGARFAAVWAGTDEGALRDALAEALALPGVQVRITAPRYRDILLEMPEPPDGAEGAPAFLGGNGLHVDLTDELIDRLTAFRSAHPASVVLLRSLGGAFGEVVQEDTPVPARDAGWFVFAGAFDVPGMLDAQERGAVLAEVQAIHADRRAEYGNFVTEERAGGAEGMHEEAALSRLRELKARWDPQNLFRRNHNVSAT